MLSPVLDTLITVFKKTEDKHYLKQPGLGECFAALLNAALSVLSWVRKRGDSMTKAAEDFLHVPKKGLRLLGLTKKRC
jgi:hypothetical protein